MAVKQIKSGTWQAYGYDRATRRKRYLGVFSTRELAEESVAFHRGETSTMRRCPGCKKPFVPEDEWQKRCSPVCEARIKKRLKRREQRIEDDHWVYTCLDDQMRVLYVGITSTGLRRHKEHGREMAWWKQIALMRIDHYPTREEALAAEAAGIALHQPPHNTVGIGEEDEAV